jgi:hypothetical protein
MFIDNLSVAPIALYHICYTAAVERQNHSLKKYMDKSVLYHIQYDTKCSEELNCPDREFLLNCEVDLAGSG